MSKLINTDNIVSTRAAAAEKNLTPRRIRQFLAAGRIEGQFKVQDDGGKSMWLMPSPVVVLPPASRK